MTDEEAKLLDAVDEHFEELICGDKVEPKVVLTLDEAKDVLHSLNCAWSRCPVKAKCKDLVKKKIEEAESKK